MRPLLNAGHDPAEYVAIARAVGVDPCELLAQAENEVGGRHRRIDLTLCSHPADGRSRRISLKNPLLRRPRCVSAAAVSEGKLSLSASCGEDWRREGDELREFPQILGCGGQ
jgi:hypothetical protein